MGVQPTEHTDEHMPVRLLLAHECMGDDLEETNRISSDQPQLLVYIRVPVRMVGHIHGVGKMRPTGERNHADSEEDRQEDELSAATQPE